MIKKGVRREVKRGITENLAPEGLFFPMPDRAFMLLINCD